MIFQDHYSGNCEVCGQEINVINSGCIEWLFRMHPRFHTVEGLRIVHERDECCYAFNDYGLAARPYSHRRIPLGDCIGSDGLMRLLNLISTKELPAKEGSQIIQRLYVPGYQLFRDKINEAIAAGVEIQMRVDNCYTVEDFKRFLVWWNNLPR